jgi:hypothetical protein
MRRTGQPPHCQGSLEYSSLYRFGFPGEGPSCNPQKYVVESVIPLILWGVRGENDATGLQRAQLQPW